MAITSAFILHQGWLGSNNEIPIKKFRIELAIEIIGGYCSQCRGGCNGALIKPLPLSHFPVKKPATSHKQHRGRCTKCYWYHKRSYTHWYCQECGVWLCHIGMESTDCFLSWHKNIIYPCYYNIACILLLCITVLYYHSIFYSYKIMVIVP